jgi:membrane-associated protein
MPYPRYLAFDIAGGGIWVGTMILGGYFLGKRVPNIGQNIHWVIAAVVVVSLLPGAIGVLRARNRQASKPSPVPVVEGGQE